MFANIPKVSIRVSRRISIWVSISVKVAMQVSIIRLSMGFYEGFLKKVLLRVAGSTRASIDWAFGIKGVAAWGLGFSDLRFRVESFKACSIRLPIRVSTRAGSCKPSRVEV